MKALFAELHKSRRRHNVLVSLAAALVALFWGTQVGSGNADRLQCGFSALFYALPLINTVMLPLTTAVLASRIWDIEQKERCCRLLFTLQSRASLFTGKTVLGLLRIALIACVEALGLPLIGRLYGFTEALSFIRLVWLLLSTFTVSAMLFFLWLLLSIRYQNQTPVLAAGTLASLSGLFSAFMPVRSLPVFPWSFFVSLSAMRMDWNMETRAVRYIAEPFPGGTLCAACAMAVLFACAAYAALVRKEV